ncbi:MAG: PEGA domain-containing protein [Planctomycetota bacterium]|jgi:hypothetical protein
MKRLATLVLAAGFALALTGCVERKMLIRSEPGGAPVWVDEVYAGTTPLDHPFSHYGLRRVRVGPVRDEHGRAQHGEREATHELEPPWYEKFPVDLFAEVLYPGRLVDEHELPLFVLPPVEEVPPEVRDQRVDEVRAQAEAFRDRALRSLPGQELDDPGE